MINVYITDLAAFLPNKPVANRDMEKILGMVNQTPSRTRSIILRNNKIRERYYAIDAETGCLTHTNAQLTAEAVRRLKPYDGFNLNDIECLACGTSSPDQLMPGHGLMVHGELRNDPCEVVSTAGICLSGISALKYVYLNITAGLMKAGVATGSELASTYMQAGICGGVDQDKARELESVPALAFDADFIRWMLSDGAGAAFVTSIRPENRLSLRIDWIEHLSFANELETCMYSGAVKNSDGSLSGWRNTGSLEEAVASGAFRVKQDVKLLNREIVTTAVDRTLSRIVAKHGIVPGSITWFLPHYSSEFFRQSLYDRMEAIGFGIPFDRWFTNLTYKGNTGSASIYIILEELFHSGRLRQGDTLLCMIPESGRFSMGYMHLTVV